MLGLVELCSDPRSSCGQERGHVFFFLGLAIMFALAGNWKWSPHVPLKCGTWNLESKKFIGLDYNSELPDSWNTDLMFGARAIVFTCCPVYILYGFQRKPCSFSASLSSKILHSCCFRVAPWLFFVLPLTYRYRNPHRHWILAARDKE